MRNKAYNLEIEHRNVSVVNVGTRENPSYLPGQCCIVMPGQVPKVHLTPSQQTGIIDFAVRRPEANIHSIKSKGLDNLGLNTDAFIQLVSRSLAFRHSHNIRVNI